MPNWRVGMLARVGWCRGLGFWLTVRRTRSSRSRSFSGGEQSHRPKSLAFRNQLEAMVDMAVFPERS